MESDVEITLELAELAQLDRIERKTERILRRQSLIMAEIDNLNSAIVNLTAAVDAALAKLQTPAGVNPADVQAAADKVQAEADRLNAG